MTDFFKKRPWWTLCFVIIALLVALDIAFTETVPPNAVTRTRMMGIERRIREFAVWQHRLPTNLAEIPPRSGFDNELTDGWGEPISYSLNSNGVVVLKSVRANAGASSIVRTFSAKDTNGNFSLSQWR